MIDSDLQAVVLTAIFWSGVALALAKAFDPGLFTLLLWFVGVGFGLILLLILISFSFQVFKQLVDSIEEFFSDIRSHY